jgi:hypothetical protein
MKVVMRQENYKIHQPVWVFDIDRVIDIIVLTLKSSTYTNIYIVTKNPKIRDYIKTNLYTTIKLAALELEKIYQHTDRTVNANDIIFSENIDEISRDLNRTVVFIDERLYNEYSSDYIEESCLSRVRDYYLINTQKFEDTKELKCINIFKT